MRCCHNSYIFSFKSWEKTCRTMWIQTLQRMHWEPMSGIWFEFCSACGCTQWLGRVLPHGSFCLLAIGVWVDHLIARKLRRFLYELLRITIQSVFQKQHSSFGYILILDVIGNNLVSLGCLHPLFLWQVLSFVGVSAPDKGIQAELD